MNNSKGPGPDGIVPESGFNPPFKPCFHQAVRFSSFLLIACPLSKVVDPLSKDLLSAVLFVSLCCGWPNQHTDPKLKGGVKTLQITDGWEKNAPSSALWSRCWCSHFSVKASFLVVSWTTTRCADCVCGRTKEGERRGARSVRSSR